MTSELVRELRRLRRDAGQPSCRELAERSGAASHDTMAALFNGTRVPRWRIVHGVVLFLGGDSDRFLSLWHAAHSGDDPGEPQEGVTMENDQRLISVRMGGKLGEALAADGITQAEFARRVGATPKHVNRVINGHAAASPQLLDYWAYVLGRRWVVSLEPRRAER